MQGVKVGGHKWESEPTWQHNEFIDNQSYTERPYLKANNPTIKAYIALGSVQAMVESALMKRNNSK